MQATRNITVSSAGIQEPLLAASQLRAGVFMAGVAGTHLWQIIEVDGPTVRLQRFPKPHDIACTTHEFTPLHSSKETVKAAQCLCGMRIQSIKALLPKERGKARVHLISCDGELNTPKDGVVYAYLLGGEPKFITLGADSRWMEALPIIPVLHKIWEVPEELRTLVLGGHIVGEIGSEDIPF